MGLLLEGDFGSCPRAEAANVSLFPQNLLTAARSNRSVHDGVVAILKKFDISCDGRRVSEKDARKVNEVDGLFACLARLRGALFVCGFVASDVNQIAEDEDAEDWIQPSALLSILSNPAFQKRK